MSPTQAHRPGAEGADLRGHFPKRKLGWLSGKDQPQRKYRPRKADTKVVQFPDKYEFVLVQVNF